MLLFYKICTMVLFVFIGVVSVSYQNPNKPDPVYAYMVGGFVGMICTLVIFAH